MRVIRPGTVRDFWAKHRDARQSLEQWLTNAQAARWHSIEDVRRTYPHDDAVTVASGATVTVFNIKGNAYRLIVAIHYNTGIVYIRDLMNHARYSHGRWKERH